MAYQGDKEPASVCALLKGEQKGYKEKGFKRMESQGTVDAHCNKIKQSQPQIQFEYE